MCFLSTITRRFIAMWSHAARERVHEGQKRGWAFACPSVRINRNEKSFLPSQAFEWRFSNLRFSFLTTRHWMSDREKRGKRKKETDNFVHNSCRQRVQPYRHLKR